MFSQHIASPDDEVGDEYSGYNDMYSGYPEEVLRANEPSSYPMLSIDEQAAIEEEAWTMMEQMAYSELYDIE